MAEQQEVSAQVGIGVVSGESFSDEPSNKSRKEDPVQSQTASVFTSPGAQPMRERLGTEETHRIRNILSPPPQQTTTKTTPQTTNRQYKTQTPTMLSIENINNYSDPFSHFHLEPSGTDDDTIVSSLSCDEDSLVVAQRNSRLAPIRELSKEFSQPPIEVAFTTPEMQGHKRQQLQPMSRMEELVANLALSNSLSGEDQLSLDYSPTTTHVNTRGPSPNVARPTLGRNRSCPVRMDFSVASSNISSIRSVTSSIPEDAIIINGSVVEGIRNRDSDVLGSHSSHSALLGQRKRRVHRRCHTGTEISVGSIVGQSTLHTSNTDTASFTDSEASSVRKALRSAGTAKELMNSYTGASDGIACCQVRRPKNLVKEELKYVMGQLASPIRMIPMFKERKAELKRSKGSLV